MQNPIYKSSIGTIRFRNSQGLDLFDPCTKNDVKADYYFNRSRDPKGKHNMAGMEKWCR